MSEQCDQFCSSCQEGCSEGCGNEKSESEGMLEPPHEMSSIRHVIGVVSGKGGVGKSLVTSLLAVAMQRAGRQAAILDADITGPSIPKIFGITGKAQASNFGILPLTSKKGIDMISLNLLIDSESDPVIWRGPAIAGMVKQFWTEVVWSDVDYLFVDMPPGTGDIPITVFQSIPIDGIIVVTSPQELVSMIVGKAVKMAKTMNIPILGLVENMSYYTCPDNGKKYNIFGESRVERTAQEHNLPILARLPIDPALASACDSGTIESFAEGWMDDIAERLIKMEENV